MNDVNLTAPNLKLIRSGEDLPGRVSASPQGGERPLSGQTVSTVMPPQTVIDEQKNARVSGAEKAELNNAVSQLNEFVQTVQRDLQFEVDHERGQTIVRVVDQETQKVIRQMPDEVALRLAENLQQDEPLTLFNLKV
ncbi:flagellar protein FlaG [Marinobacter zhejiangensis]|uniref:Flagellar protein FlaG n=1 Tax=Marinobacter zhejiangensis TaxID=488535 RepID=A0A1I4QRY5_9GAMM|nr:flagellar protein FlaG [Marinobacter zhejiangensis]SFM42453.1 flagellar protein FlaG [Marinobacter zhejiangensis]